MRNIAEKNLDEIDVRVSHDRAVAQKTAGYRS